MTNIDSLQIQIVSSSKGAATSIRELAGALGELRDNGSITTAVKNLNKLRDSLRLFNNIPSNASKVLSLARSMEQLKNVGSVGKVGNSIAKLAEGLKSLNTISVDGSKITSIASALSTLSNIKAGGVNTMMNGLLKIDKVTEALDEKTIAAFAERIEKLTEKLSPLSQKMTTVQAGLKSINSAAKSAGSSAKKMGEDIDGASINLSSFIYTIQEAVNWLQQAIQKFSSLMTEAIEWDGIAARFGRGFGDQAQEVYDWIVRLNEEMGINIQQFMQYSSVYATMLKGFGVASEDAGEMALGYMELTYDIWAGYNDVYKTLGETAEAVKSAIAGEVEPVRRAGFTIVETQLEQTAINEMTEAQLRLNDMLSSTSSNETLAQTAANHGLTFSIETATEAQKSYLRYLTLVDQAHAQNLVGTYAAELNTAEGMVRTFSQQLKSLTQTLGSLFLPILVKVMPWLQAFVELLIDAVHWLAGLLGVEIQAVDFSGYEAGAGAIENVTGSAEGATDALGSAAKAAEDLKKATLGIDELNVISPPSATGGSGGSSGGGGGGGLAGLDVESLWDETIFDTIQSDVDEIKEKLKGWMPVIAGIAIAFAGLRLLKLLDDVNKVKKALKGLGAGGGIFAGIKAAFAGISQWIAAAKQNAPFVGWFAALFPKLSGWLPSIWGWVSKLGSVISQVGTAISSIGLGPLALIIAGIASSIYFLYENWDQLGEEIEEFIELNISPKLEKIKEHFNNIKEALEPLGDLLAPVIQGIKDLGIAIGDWFKDHKIGDWVLKVVEFIGGLFTFSNGIVGAILAVVNIFVGAIENIVQIVSGIIQFISGSVKIIGSFFGKGDASAGYDQMTNGLKDIFGGGISLPFDALVDGITGFTSAFGSMLELVFDDELIPEKFREIALWVADGLKTGLSDAWDDLKEWVSGMWDEFIQWAKDILGIASPSTVFAEIGKWIVEGLWNGITELWENFITWFDETFGGITDFFDSDNKFEVSVSLVKDGWKTVKDWIGKIPAVSQTVNLVKKGWSSVKKWIGNIPSVSQAVGLAKKGWSSVKKWIGNIPTVSQAVSLAKKGWTTVRNWIGNTPTLSAGIRLVKDGWTSVKNWLGGLDFDLKFKLPKIGIEWGKKTVLGFTISYPEKFYTYAQGGFPSAGEFFLAREAGPEMVGRIGNRSAVANNDQIVDAVSQGVYSAVMAAMSAGGKSDDQAINIYLDGKKITASVEKHQRERGATIMGSQVYSY